MRERGEVAGRTEGALLIDHGEDILVEHVHQPLNRDELYAGMAVGKILDLEEEHQLHYLRAYRLPGATGVGYYQIVLEL